MARSSVKGLDEFRRHMQGLEGSYVVIGGTACDILLTESDLDFRATHDLDTVLVADARLPETARAIWSLVKDGGYRCGWGDDNTCFYRFTDPGEEGYPAMLELFGKRPGFMGNMPELVTAPMHVGDDVSSLSAILLDDAYFELMLGGIRTVDDVSVLDATHLIPFKAKAHLDLKSRKELGEPVDSGKIRKHRNDALRLAQLLTGSELVPLPDPIAEDMRGFLVSCESEQVNLRQIGITAMTLKDILGVLREIYQL